MHWLNPLIKAKLVEVSVIKDYLMRINPSNINQLMVKGLMELAHLRESSLGPQKK